MAAKLRSVLQARIEMCLNSLNLQKVLDEMTPFVQFAVEQDGGFSGDADPGLWQGFIVRAYDQLLWWSEAAKAQRGLQDHTMEAFTRIPSQRNAPVASGIRNEVASRMTASS